MKATAAMTPCTAGMKPSLRGIGTDPTAAMAAAAQAIPTLNASAILRCRRVAGTEATDSRESSRELWIVMSFASINERAASIWTGATCIACGELSCPEARGARS